MPLARRVQNVKNSKDDASTMAKGSMVKERVTKDDGRYLIFYRFVQLGDSGILKAERPNEGRT